MKKLKSKNSDERILLDVSGRKATLKTGKETINYTAFIDFDKTAQYEKITKIRLVNCL